MKCETLLLILVTELFSSESKHVEDEAIKFHNKYRRQRRVTPSSHTGINKVNRKSTENQTEQNIKFTIPPESINVFGNEVLVTHNYYREKHGVPPLKLSEEMCFYATKWANKIATDRSMEHRLQNKYGENIYYAWTLNPNFTLAGNVPVDIWYNEVSLHTFGKEPTDMRSGHFTQVVWKDTKRLGVGIAKSKYFGEIFVVANYFPPGNILGEFVDNVPPPSK